MGGDLSALAEGRQALILRKGGIAEDQGAFRPEHAHFWLYPTFFHEHRSGIRPEYLPLLEAAEADRPPVDTIRLTHFADVSSVHFVDDLEAVRRLAPLHAWTDEVVAQRFHYRKPGLFVLVVRLSRIEMPEDQPERPEYAGCKTWITLDPPVPILGAEPVLDKATFAEYAQRVAEAVAR